MLLEKMLRTMSPSGFEDEMRALVLENVRDFEPYVDTMGNVICHKRGTGKKVLVSAHMDEVGIIISKITDSGALKFKTIGGIETTVMAGKRVIIGKDKLKGVIGTKAIHLQSGSERGKKYTLDDFVIDIGAKNADEAKKRVKIGDYGTFDGEPVEFGDNLLKSRGLDDKVGCAIIAELLKENNDLDLYASFTVQEEVGLRGSIIAANRIQPDYAIIFEGTTCSDVYPTEEHKTVTRLHGGAALTAMDRAAIADRAFLKLITDCAREENIKYQIKRTTMGGTDAGSIQRSGCGVKTAVISTPCRYIHSPVSVMCKDDFYAALALGKSVLRKLGEI